MKHEKSCGAIVFRDFSDTRKALLIKHIKSGHWSFPKGHVEGAETEEETALREVKEETGLTVTLDTGFRYVTTYSPASGITKDVVYFVAFAKNCNAMPQPEEIKCVDWFDFPCARATITHKADRKIFDLAVKYLEGSNK